MPYTLVGSLPEAAVDAIWSVAWLEESSIVAGSSDASVRTYTVGDADSQLSLQHEMKGHELAVLSVSASKDGSVVASSSMDASIRIWDPKRGVPLGPAVIDAGACKAWTVALSPDGKVVASGSHAGCLNLWSVETGQMLASMPVGAGKFLMSVAFSPGGEHVACGAVDGGVHMFDLRAETQSAELPSPHLFGSHVGPSGPSAVRAVAFASGGGGVLASGADDARLNLYDVRARAAQASMEGHTSWVLGASFAPGDAAIASCSADRSVRVWDIGQRQCVQALGDAHSDQAWGIAFDPSGAQRKRFALVGDDTTLRCYEERGEAS